MLSLEGWVARAISYCQYQIKLPTPLKHQLCFIFYKLQQTDQHTILDYYSYCQVSLVVVGMQDVRLF